MSGPSAAVAAVRVAVRHELAHELVPGNMVLVACSGGADSLALLAATLFEGPRAGIQVGAVTIDHGWAPDSADRTEAVVAAAQAAGADPAVARTAHTAPSEDAARRARYGAIDAVADQTGAAAVLLGHTLDDQAETVLLGLSRGSGARSLGGMPARRGRYRRPLLELRRDTVRAAALEAGLTPWEDPANADRGFLRSRLRHDVLPVLEQALGPGVVEALGRTAGLLRADADALDEWAATVDPGELNVSVDELLAVPLAVRSRVIRAMAIRAGAGAGALSAVHVAAVEALLSSWHGQGPVALPDGLTATRRCGRLWVQHAR